MPVSPFDAFRSELGALRGLVASHEKKMLRDEDARERVRALFRTWVSVVRPSIEGLLASKRELYKLEAEIERLALLTSKTKPIEEYNKRLGLAVSLASNIVLYLPSNDDVQGPVRVEPRGSLFIAAIPDLPEGLVPNSLFGWRRQMENFLGTYPFDKSVFIMVRYRERNAGLIRLLKRSLSAKGFNGILASEHDLTNDLYNPVACLLCCSKGIAIFDKAEVDQDFNPNVAYELGMMHLLGRPVLILKHNSLQSLHTDILMRLYVEYNSPNCAASQVEKWVCA